MTHGKEVEFLVRYVYQLDPEETGADPKEDLKQLKKANPGVVAIPWGEEAGGIVPVDCVRALKRNGVDINHFETDPEEKRARPVTTHHNAQYCLLAEFHRWNIEDDLTVEGTAEDRKRDKPAPGQPHFGWYGLELISPANPNTAASHQEMCFVLGVLRQKYGDRMRVNDSCGLHVHVGMGPYAIPVDRLKRIAAFLYAADPLISVLHPPNLQDNEFCCSIRRHANVTWGMTAAAAAEEIAGSTGGGSGMPIDGVWDAESRTGRQPVPLRDAVRELLACETGHGIYRLLQYLDRGCNYNFNNYRVIPEPKGFVTIEFRQHEGTLDPARIEAWARLCVGLTEWAAFDMTEEQLGEVAVATETVERQQKGVDALRQSLLRQLLGLGGIR
ncbi:hypothetical protein PG997_007090 [Apiospora hydei]|uniref:Amidoligase enzyme n=1 Tax=Apiospora hydei TaxID=1337664 RepID=A0ABR1WSA7_9PEZI